METWILVWPVFNSLAITEWMGTRIFPNCTLTSASIPIRSDARISSVDLNVSFTLLAQVAFTHRSGSSPRRRAFTTLAQSHLWIDTPNPRVIKPMISSPGSGLQHRANLIKQPSSPSTITPLEAFCEVFLTVGARVCSGLRYRRIKSSLTRGMIFSSDIPP